MEELLSKYGLVRVTTNQDKEEQAPCVSYCVLPVEACEEIGGKSFTPLDFSSILNKKRPNNLEKLQKEEIDFITNNQESLEIFDVSISF